MKKNNDKNYISIPQLQYSIYDMICRAYRKLKEIPCNYYLIKIYNENLSCEERNECLDFNVLAESYRMFIINYLCVLLGNRKNDKISIPNNVRISEKEIVDEFFKSNKSDIDLLYGARDKVYSHFDESNTDIIISNNFVKNCLEFIKTYFDKIDELKPENILKTINECKKVLDIYSPIKILK